MIYLLAIWGRQTHVGSRNLVLDGGARWCHLAKTTERLVETQAVATITVELVSIACNVFFIALTL